MLFSWTNMCTYAEINLNLTSAFCSFFKRCVNAVRTPLWCDRGFTFYHCSLQAVARYVYFHVLLFVMANISQVYWITFMKCLRDNDITKQLYVVFLLLEAAHCCRASFEGPAFPSGSHVGLYSYFVICYGKHFTLYFSLVFIFCYL